MPIIKERLFDPDWRARESGVLALGAISEGCSHGLHPHLGEIVSAILPLLDDPKPLVRLPSAHPPRPLILPTLVPTSTRLQPVYIALP